MSSAPLSILVAFAGYSLLNVAQALQKLGLARYRTHRLSGGTLWVGATIGTSASVFVLFYAVSLGSVSIVGAMAGTGLASLAVFSALVMKERITVPEIAGLAVILGAAVFIGLFAEEAPAREARLVPLFIYSAAVVVLFTLAWIVFGRGKAAGLIIGGFAGALGGLVPLYQKLSTSAAGKEASWSAGRDALSSSDFVRRAMEILLNPYALLWIAFSLLSMAVLQFSYRRDRAIRIVPVFSAIYIVVPIIGGVIGLRESLRSLQWAGVALILLGVLMMSVRLRTRRPASPSGY